MVRKFRSHASVTSGMYIPYFCVIFTGMIFAEKLAELPQAPTHFISCWEKVKEIKRVISFIYDAKKAMKAHEYEIFIPFHIAIYFARRKR
jgi:DNA phosphorothioation-dependent restriction protein DptG